MSNLSTLSQPDIESRIFTIRGQQVMIDRDLAEIYGVSTGRLNEQVKRNPDRFPSDFVFQLTKQEWEILQNMPMSNRRNEKDKPSQLLSSSEILKSQNARSSW
jgi:hypothetical protein